MNYLLVCGKKNLENPDTKTTWSIVKEWQSIQDQLGITEIKKPVNRRENLICNTFRLGKHHCPVWFYASPVRSVKGQCKVNTPDFTSSACPNSWENCFSWALLFCSLQIVVLIKKSCSCVTQPTGSEEEIPNFIITLANSSQRSPRCSAEHQHRALRLAGWGRMLRRRLLTLCSVSPSSFTMGAFCQRAT